MSPQTTPIINGTTSNAPKKVRFSLPDRQPEIERTTSPLPPSSPQPWTSPLKTDNGESEDDGFTIPFLSDLSDDPFESEEPQTLEDEDEDDAPHPQAIMNDTLTTAFSADVQHLFSLIRTMSIAAGGFLHHWEGIQMPYGLEEFIRDVVVALPHDHVEYPATRHRIAASLNEWIEAHPRPIVQGITELPRGEPLSINVDEYTSVQVEQVLFDKESFGESEYTIYGRDTEDENCELINGDRSLGDINIPNIGYNSPCVRRPSRNAAARPPQTKIVKAHELRQPVVFITEEVERDEEYCEQAYEEIDWPSIAMLQVYEDTEEPPRLAPEADEADDDDEANRLLGPPPITFADPGESGTVRDPLRLRRSRSVALRREVSDDGWCTLLDPTRGTDIDEDERSQGKDEVDKSQKEDEKEGDRPPDEDDDSPRGLSSARPRTPETAENEHDDTLRNETRSPVPSREGDSPPSPPDQNATEHPPSNEPQRSAVIPPSRGRKRGREGDANEGATEEEKRPTRRLRSHMKKT